MLILIDDREKCPFRLPTHDGNAPSGSHALPQAPQFATSGDYTIAGHEKHLAIERKKASELYQTVGSGRARFRHELERLREIHEATEICQGSGPPHRHRIGYACIIVEGSLSQVIGLGSADAAGFTKRGQASAGRGRRVTAEMVIATLTAWSVEFGVPIWFAGELEIAERLAWSILGHARWR